MSYWKTHKTAAVKILFKMLMEETANMKRCNKKHFKQYTLFSEQGSSLYYKESPE